MFFIKSLDYTEEFYHEQTSVKRRWSLKGLQFSQFTVITGQNSSGKTRISNIIKNTISRIVKAEKLQLGKTDIAFRIANNKCYRYSKDVAQDEEFKNILLNEELWEVSKNVRDKMLFNREKIRKSSTNRFVSYSPPDDQLTFYVRRDKIHHEYIEKIIQAAKHFYFLDFGEKMALVKLSNIGEHLPAEIQPAMTPTFFDVFVDESKKEKIIKEINMLGFPITNLFVKPIILGGHEILDLYIEEEGVE